MTMLQIDGLEARRGSFELGPIDLTIGAEVLVVLGPSGCGKTTLLSLLAGIATPEAGRITLDGERLDGRPPDRRGTVLVFQDGALFPHLTARENVAYAAVDDVDVESLAATLEIREVLDRSAATLSGGEAQRVALARALAADPAALLLDEPLANLDAPIRRRLRVDLRDLLRALPIPVVYVTHDQTGASSVGDRVAVMNDGTIEQIGSPAAIFERPETPFVAGFTGGPNVFPGVVADDRRVEWEGLTLEADVQGYDPGDAVWVCLRAEAIQVGDDLVVSMANSVEATIADRIREGGTDRLVVQPDGTETTLDVTVLAGTVERDGLTVRDRVGVRIPPEAVHLVDREVGVKRPPSPTSRSGAGRSRWRFGREL